jgi:hypothetical protein
MNSLSDDDYPNVGCMINNAIITHRQQYSLDHGCLPIILCEYIVKQQVVTTMRQSTDQSILIYITKILTFF